MQDAGNSGQWNSSRRGNQIFVVHCENFAGIAKISLGLRKFHNHSENFAILAKFSLYKIFASLAKITVHSENFDFRSLVIFAMLAKFR